MRPSPLSTGLLCVALLLGLCTTARADEAAGPTPTGAPAAPAQSLDEQPVAPVRQQVDPTRNLPVVQLRTDNPRARLQIFQQRWKDVCAAPCNLNLNPVGPYRVGGGPISNSSSFGLPRRSGPVLIEAKTGTKVGYWVGFGLTMAGLAAAANGGLYFLLADNTTADSSEAAGNTRDAYRTAGKVSLVAAAILVAVGLPLWLSNDTSVEID